MDNSPTICQEVVSAALKTYLEKGRYIYHYMDDILLADSDALEKMFGKHKEFCHAGVTDCS